VLDGVVAAAELQEGLVILALDLQARVPAVRAVVISRESFRPAIERVADVDVAAVVRLPHAQGGVVAIVPDGRSAMGSGNQDGKEKRRQPVV
jgi:hypothetical protein